MFCVRKRSYTYAHGGVAHAAVETNGGLQTDANYRPISVITRAIIMIAAEQQWNCMTLIGRRWVVKIMNINNLMSKSAAAMAAPAAAVPTPMNSTSLDPCSSYSASLASNTRMYSIVAQ